MAELHGLIRLRKHELDEKRRILGELNKQLSQLESQKQNLLDRIEKEKSLTQNDWQASRDFAIFLKGALHRRNMIDQSIRALMIRIEEATNIVHEAFREVKKLEIAQENREKRAKKEQKRKDTVLLDDIGIEGWRRKTEENQ